MTPSTDRIPAAERRASILEAATAVFGEFGYAGTTTDRVARAAGISQPYVVRMFGGKENLFVEVLQRTLARVLDAFHAAIADTADERPIAKRIGAAYVDLVEDRGILLSLMQGLILGHDPRIGPVARDGLMEIYRVLRDEAGFPAEEVRRFLADGMLINTLLASGLTGRLGTDDDADELFECTFRDKLPLVLDGLGDRVAATAASAGR